MLAPSGPEHVLDSEYGLALDLVAVSLVPLRVLQGFRVGEGHGAPHTSARLQHGVGIRQVRLVEQHGRARVGRDHEIALALEEGIARRDPLRAPNGGEANDLLLHRRNGTGHELPQPGFAGDGGPADLGTLRRPPLADTGGPPGVVGKGRLLPSPRVPGAIDRLSRRSRVVAAGGGPHHRDGRVARVAQHLPLGSRIRHRFPVRITLQEEGGAAAELRDGAIGPPVPDERGQHVVPRAQVGRPGPAVSYRQCMRSERCGPDDSCCPLTKNRYRLSAETWTTKCSGGAASRSTRRKWNTPNALPGASASAIQEAGGAPPKTGVGPNWASLPREPSQQREDGQSRLSTPGASRSSRGLPQRPAAHARVQAARTGAAASPPCRRRAG